MLRPKQPKFTDHTDIKSYYELNRYYNEAEKIFDKIELALEKICDECDDEKWLNVRLSLIGIIRGLSRKVKKNG